MFVQIEKLPDNVEIWGDKADRNQVEVIYLNINNVVYLSKRDYSTKVILTNGLYIYVDDKNALKIVEAVISAKGGA